MKNFLAVLMLFFATIPAVAQQPVTIKMPGNFYSLQAAKTQPYLLMTSRPSNEEGYLPNGVFSVIDANTGQSLWMDEIDFIYDAVFLTDYGVVVYRGAAYELSTPKAYVYDIKTGNEIRKLKYLPSYISPTSDYIIGIRKGFKPECHKISTNDFMWKTKLRYDNAVYWEDCEVINEDSILFLGKCLSLFDTKTGAVKEYKLKTIDTRLNFIFLPSWTSIVGLFKYSFYVAFAKGYFPTYTPLHSNILLDGDYIYISDKTHIACLDKSLNEKWRYTFPRETASHAMLACKGDTVFMLNTGMKGVDSKHRYGDAFFASFNKNMGTKYSFDLLPEKWGRNVFGKYLSFITDSIYFIDRSSQTIKPIEGYGKAYPIWSTEGEVMMVDSKLEVQKKYTRTDVYVKWCDVDGLSIMGTIEGKAEPYVVDSDGKIVKALPEGCFSAKVAGKRLYLCIGHEVKIYNTDNFMNYL